MVCVFAWSAISLLNGQCVRMECHKFVNGQCVCMECHKFVNGQCVRMECHKFVEWSVCSYGVT